MDFAVCLRKSSLFDVGGRGKGDAKAGRSRNPTHVCKGDSRPLIRQHALWYIGNGIYLSRLIPYYLLVPSVSPRTLTRAFPLLVRYLDVMHRNRHLPKCVTCMRDHRIVIDESSFRDLFARGRAIGTSLQIFFLFQFPPFSRYQITLRHHFFFRSGRTSSAAFAVVQGQRTVVPFLSSINFLLDRKEKR